MRKLLALAVALLAFSSVAQAQFPPAADVTYLNTDLTAGAAVLDGTVFPNVDSYFTDSDFTPYAAGAAYAANGGLGSPTAGAGTFVGPGGVTLVTVAQAGFGGNIISGAATITVVMTPTPAMGPIYSNIGYLAVTVIPMDPFHPAPPYMTWFPVAYSPYPLGGLWSFTWSTGITVPPHSVVIVGYQGTAFGVTALGICPGVSAEQFIF